MYLVALLQSILDPEERALKLTRLVGITQYEARQHATQPLPRALASRPDLDSAQALAAQLTQEGLPSAALGPDDLLSDARRFFARHILVSEAGIGATRKDGVSAELPWGDVAAVVGSLKKGKANVDVVDGAGAVLCVREGEVLLDANTGLGTTGAKAACAALAQIARQRSNARIDDRLMKPNALAQVLGGFQSLANADDFAATIVYRGLLV